MKNRLEWINRLDIIDEQISKSGDIAMIQIKAQRNKTGEKKEQ